ncbi:type II secretion system protein [Paenibacillus oryzisoli]|uniref:type II secretion system protein n=1 Tax=Paenibacillus oryzisoli TaxID=1850517 RepID=UPI003D28F40E
MLVKMMNRLKKEEKGFTLIELLAVIVILAVIAAIAVPYILGVIDKSKKDADVAAFNQIYNAAQLYIAAGSSTVNVPSTGTGSVSVATLISEKFLDTGIVYPSTKATITAGTLNYTDGKLSGNVTITAGTKTFSLPSTAVVAGSSSSAPTEVTAP